MRDPQLLSFALLMGIAPITGSFLGVLIHRIPAGRKVGIDRSVCDVCGHVLNAFDLMPVINWVFSRGRCRYCGAGVSYLYPVIEIAALGLVVWAWSVFAGWQLWASCILGWALMVAALINVSHFTVPGPLILPMLLLGLGFSWFAEPGAFADHLAGMVVGGAMGIALDILDRRLDDRLGFGGDADKLFAAAGAWLAWQGLPGLVAIAVAIGLVVSVVGAPRRWWGGRLAGGACVALGLWLAWLYGPLTANW
ncbi:MAG: prepilin peptidase [Alphaproteobacteria bacterium]|jgi:leader peptidase (prepilin peptidase)/N-methyltransferase